MARVTITELEKRFKEFYNYNDEAHKFNHVEEVLANALFIEEVILTNYGFEKLAILAYIHDMYSGLDRLHHHTLAQQWVLDNKFDKIFRNFKIEEIDEIAYAVGEHRASFKGEYTSKLSELLSAADKGKLELTKYIKRIYSSYNNKNNSYGHFNGHVLPTHGAKIGATLTHLKSKFSRTGYMRLNSVYKEVYKDDIEQFYLDVDLIDLRAIDKITGGM